MRLRTSLIVLALTAGTIHLYSGTAHAEPVTGTVTVTNDAWTHTSRQQPAASHWNGPGDLPIGLDQRTGELNRSFVQLGLRRFAGFTVTKATLQLNRAEPCVPGEKAFQLWQTSKITAKTTWNREPEWITMLGDHPDAWGCPPPGYEGYSAFHFDVTAPFHDAVADGETRLAFGLRTVQEDNPLGRYLLSSHVQVEVTYTGPASSVVPDIPGSPATERFQPAAWALVSRNDPDTPYWNTAAAPSVGRDPATGDRTRSYFRYDLPALKDKRLLQARLTLRGQASCQDYARGFELWETAAITDQTTWKNKAKWVRELGEIAPSPSCPSPGPVELDATAAVAAALAAGKQEVTLGLRSREEKDVHGHYVFEPAPELQISYNVPPGPPRELLTGTRVRVPCVSGDARSYLPDKSVRVSAVVPDAAGTPLTARWQWETLDGELLAETVTGPGNGPPGMFTQQFSDARVVDGGVYRWRVRGEDLWDAGEWSPWCEYGVDATPPTKTPGVSSTTYPPYPEGGGIGVAGEFTLSSNDDPDVTGFKYSFDGSTWTTVSAHADGTATIVFTPTSAGRQYLIVYGVDRAGNTNANARIYFFYVKS